MNPGRRPVRELTGQNWVPVLVTDDGEVVRESQAIVDWARDNPAAGADKTSSI
jgi:glutathione S-transferase